MKSKGKIYLKDEFKNLKRQNIIFHQVKKFKNLGFENIVLAGYPEWGTLQSI